MKPGLVFLSLIAALWLWGCGNGGPAGPAAAELAGFWLFQLAPPDPGAEAPEPFPVAFRTDGDRVDIGGEKPCEVAAAGDSLTLTCPVGPRPLLDIIDCEISEFDTITAAVSGDSISGTWTVEYTFAGPDCGRSVLENEFVPGTFTFTGRRSGPDPDNRLSLTGEVSGTEFEIETAQVVCFRREEPEQNLVLYSLTGWSGPELFGLTFIISPGSGEADFVPLITLTTSRTPTLSYEAYAVELTGAEITPGLLSAEFEFSDWDVWETFPFWEITATREFDRLTGMVSVSCLPVLEPEEE